MVEFVKQEEYASVSAGAASRICYSIVLHQFLNWCSLTPHRGVRFNHSNLSNNFQKNNPHPVGWVFGVVRATESSQAASQICYGIVVDQFLNWSPATVRRTVAFSYSNLSIKFQKQKAILSDGLLFLELLARFELATSSLPRMRSTG